MVDPRDLGLVSQVRSPHHEAPTIYLYEAMPGGVGLSERLFDRHDELVARSVGPHPRLRVRRGLPRLHGPAARAGRRWQGARAAAAGRRSAAAGPRARRSRDDRARARASAASAGWRTCGRRSRVPAARRSGRPATRPGAVRRPAEPRAGGAPRRRARGRRRRRAPAGSSCAGRWRRSSCRSTASGWATCPATRRRTRRSCASTPRPRASRPPRARWRSSSASRAGRATRSARRSCCSPTTPDEPALLAEIAAWIPPDVWLVTLQRPRHSTGRCSRPATGWPRRAAPGARRPSRPAPVRAPRVPAPHGRRAAADGRGRAAGRLPHRRRGGLGDPRSIYLDVLRGGAGGRPAGRRGRSTGSPSPRRRRPGDAQQLALDRPQPGVVHAVPEHAADEREQVRCPRGPGAGRPASGTGPRSAASRSRGRCR